MERPNAWKSYNEQDLAALTGIGERYKNYLNHGKTERECVTTTVELAKAQGFPDDYILQVSNSYSKSAQIARIGNSVCPVMSEVLVRANLPELCGKKIKTMAQLKKTLTA